MKKTTKKESLISQLKAIPNQVKVFILGTFVVVLALASILPNLNSKSLQGSVLNVKMSSKVDGYGYTQDMLDAFDYAYSMWFVSTSNIDDADMYGTIKNAEVSNILNQFATRNGLEPVVLEEGYPNSLATKGYFVKYLVLTIWPANYTTDESIYAKAKHEGLINSVNPEILSQLEVKGYAYLILKRAQFLLGENVCQTPEAILACELMLNECPTQCRPDICQSAEMILSCSFGLDTCVQECRYGWVNTGEMIKDIAIMDYNFVAANNREAKVSFNLSNKGNIIMPIDGIGTDLYINNKQVKYNLDFLQVLPTELNPGESKFVSFILRPEYDVFTNNTVAKVSVSTYPETDQNPANNDVKIYLTGNINQNLEIDEPVIVEEVVPQVVEETKEEVREAKVEAMLEDKQPEESADSMMQMIQNLLK